MIQLTWDLLAMGFTVIAIITGIVAVFTILGHVFGRLSVTGFVAAGAQKLANLVLGR